MAVRGGDPRKPRRGVQVEKGPVRVRSSVVVQQGPQVIEQQTNYLFDERFFGGENFPCYSPPRRNPGALREWGYIGLSMTQVATTQVSRFIQKLKKPSPKGPQFGKVFHTFLPLTSRGSHLPHDVLQVQGDHGGLTLD